MAFVCSAYFSGSETALISAHPVKMEVWVRQKRRGALIAHEFMQSPERFLIAILIGNNIAVVVASTLMAIYLERMMGGVLITVVTALLLMIFGEILPKAIAREQATTMAIRISPLLRMVYFLMYPLIRMVRFGLRSLLKFVHVDPNQMRNVLSRMDMERLVRESERAGVVNPAERDLISRFILRGNLRVCDVMIPRTEMVSVSKKESIRKTREIFRETGFSRLPVTGENEDDVLGMVLARDLILKRPRRLGEVVRNILFVPETRNVSRFLTEFQEQPSGMAIVVDEYGGTAGLITFEDVVEEFFGEIEDEHDEASALIRKATGKQVDVHARIEVHELNEQFRLRLPEGEYSTLGGFMLDYLGHIPKRGEKIVLPHCILTVLSSTQKRIKWVRIQKKESEIAK